MIDKPPGDKMEIYEIHRCGEGEGEVLLKGPLGELEELQIESAAIAAKHAQYCAQGGEAILRVFSADGMQESERPIPPRDRADGFGGYSTKPLTWF